MTQATIRYFVMVLGNTMNSHKRFMDRLTISPKLREASLLIDCDVIMAFVPIVSRASTDILAAMEKIPQNKPVVLVVLHHTFSPDYVAPDSRFYVKEDNMFAVDCLYHEEQGLLTCLHNDDAIRAVKEHLIRDDDSQVNRSPCRWKLLVVVIGVNCILGICVGITVGKVNIGAGISSGIAVAITVAITVAIAVGIAVGQFVNNRTGCAVCIIVGTVACIVITAVVAIILAFRTEDSTGFANHTMI